jgi:hypothetical protein
MLCQSNAFAQDQPDKDTQAVVVSGARTDPEKISYDKLLDAMAIFDKDHARAPDATLQFRLIPRHKFDTSGLHLSIKTDDEKIPVDLTPALLFALPVIDRLKGKDAYLVVNKNSDNFRWRAFVHSPNVAANAIRFGDLRVGCRIDFKAGLSHYFGPAGAVIANTYADPCMDAPSINQPSFYTFRPVFGVTIIDGDRKQELETKYMWRSGQQDELTLPFFTDYERMFLYAPPIRDLTWSDATLIVFNYMDDSDEPKTTDN